MDSSSFDPMDMMKSMMNPEEQEMFEMYNTMFEQEFENENNSPDTGSQKGDTKNE